jgi:hypothetical protein
MKNPFLKHLNAIHSTKDGQIFINHDPGFRQTGYTNPEIRNDMQSIHSYIVEWQVEEETKKSNSLLHY